MDLAIININKKEQLTEIDVEQIFLNSSPKRLKLSDRLNKIKIKLYFIAYCFCVS